MLKHWSIMSLGCYQSFLCWKDGWIWCNPWFKLLHNCLHIIRSIRRYLHLSHKILQWSKWRRSPKTTSEITKPLEGNSFIVGVLNFHALFEVRNIMPVVISYHWYSLESLKRAIKWILVPDNVMTLSRVTVNFKLDNKVVLLPVIMHRKCQSRIVRSYGMESMTCRTEERVRLSSLFKIVGCITGQ